MLVPRTHTALLYVSTILGSLSGVMLFESMVLRVLFGVMACYFVLCFWVTRSWLVPFAVYFEICERMTNQNRDESD